MNFITHLKRVKNHVDTRWFVKYDKKGFVREVKQVHNPEDYKKNKRRRELLNKEELIEILEQDKIKKLKIK